ncbi:GPR1/FUN34/yaaH family-domain-containing protein [Camillea tinctor]|nr:GPR1/FUN34/yaaH family-domain-containing protein [Camillea tinctor]
MATREIPAMMNHHDEEKGLHRSATGVTMSPELFEKLYLTPKVPHTGDYHRRFANPTALGFIGFVIAASTFAMIMMGWGGANGLSPVAGIFFFVGPVVLSVAALIFETYSRSWFGLLRIDIFTVNRLMLLALIFEWIMGNFFSMMVMGLFTVFWLSFGLLQVPNLQLGAPYATPADPTGIASTEYNAAIGLYLLVWGFAFFTFFLFTLKINTILATIFGLTTTAGFVLSAAYFKASWGDLDAASNLQKAGGAIIFVVAFLGWYMCFIIMAGEMRITVKLPVGDLSRFWPRTDIDLVTNERRE